MSHRRETRAVLNPDRRYTDMQLALLDNLFSKDCQGDALAAARKAGYTPHGAHNAVVGLRQEILEATKAYLAQLAPQAAAKLGEILSHPTRPGHQHALKAVDGVLDRVGLSKAQTHEVTHSVRGVVELPAKTPPPGQGDVVDAEVLSEEDP
mgnify:CR=1 FL=1